MGTRFQIEVVYALPDEQFVLQVELERAVSIGEVIARSGMLERFPELVLQDDMVGIYGYRYPLDHLVSPGDRVEIYRPLEMRPTEARRLRAAARQNKNS